MPADLAPRLLGNLERVILGKRHVLEQVVTALFAGGHVLLEDVPGVGKTMLGKALARSLDLPFRRLQFTADLLPADILGVSVYDPAQGTFQFKKGPIFMPVLLADELNRSPPRTQSSLLEALEDRRITVDGEEHALPAPFFVIATQNPIDFAGTYPLPESELDRFLLCTGLGHPDRVTEREILARHRNGLPIEQIKPVATVAEVLDVQERVAQVRVDDSIVEYLLDVIEATRRDARIHLGASPRASLAFERAARARALLFGRTYCVPDDVKELAVPVLAHRILPSGASDHPRSQAERIVRDLLERLAVPT